MEIWGHFLEKPPRFGFLFMDAWKWESKIGSQFWVWAARNLVWPLARREKLDIEIHWQEGFDTLVLRWRSCPQGGLRQCLHGIHCSKKRRGDAESPVVSGHWHAIAVWFVQMPPPHGSEIGSSLWVTEHQTEPWPWRDGKVQLKTWYSPASFLILLEAEGTPLLGPGMGGKLSFLGPVSTFLILIKHYALLLGATQPQFPPWSSLSIERPLSYHSVQAKLDGFRR